MRILLATLILSSLHIAAIAAATDKLWKIGTPITTYYLGSGTEKQMAEGGFNLIERREKELDAAGKYGLRVQLVASELWRVEGILDNKEKTSALDALIERVKRHPAMYAYFIVDEPSASRFAELGRLVSHIREKDPAHLAWINLFPTYATNKQLGTKGDTVQAYREYLRLFIEKVKPDMLSYDHYHFKADGTDGQHYFLNLSLIRQAALDAGIPFMNCVQACTWSKEARAPNRNEMRWLNYTSLAYGAQAIMYFVYNYEPFYKDALKRGVYPGGMMRPDGSTTAQYETAKILNPQFVEIATQLQPLVSLGAYHIGKLPLGTVALPKDAPFTLEFRDQSQMPGEGMLLGYFGTAASRNPTHVLVVNLNYKYAVTTTVIGPGQLSQFNTMTRSWPPSIASRMAVTFPPGGGALLGLQNPISKPN